MDLATALFGVLVVLMCMLLFLFIYMTALLAWNHAKYDHLPGPKRDSFYLGHMIVILSSTRQPYDDTADKKASELKPLHFNLFIDWFNRYGDTFVFFVLHQPIVVSRSPTVHRMLLVDTDQRIIAKGSLFSLTRLYDYRYLGEGLATAVDHDAWYQRRKAIDPIFHRHQLRLSVDVFNTAADIFMQELVGYAESGETFQLNPILHLTTFDVIMKTMFSMESTSLHTDFHKQATKFVEESFMEFQASLAPFSKYYPWRRRQRKYICELLDSFRQVGGKMIAERRDSIARGDVVPRDFLTTMIEASADPATGYTDEVMKDEFITMIIAGMETSANTLGFVFMELGRNPEFVQRLIDEVDEVVGKRTFISSDDMAQLPFITSLIKETLRFYPPVSDIIRLIKKEVVVDGQRIPANTSMFFSLLAANRNEEFLENANQFDPDRFDRNQEKRVPVGSFATFSHGPRNCIGQVFAQMEMKVMIAKFFQHYEFVLDDSEEFEISLRSTVFPRSGLKCTIKARV